MNSCLKCPRYKKKDLSGYPIGPKISSVSGFCMDSDNPDFNAYAREYGRGIARLDSLITPKWCAKRKNPQRTKPYYTDEEIDAFVRERKEWE